MSTITPFLWFDDKAEEAMKFYVAIFKNSKVLGVAPGPDGKVMSATFELNGQEFMALNGGPMFTFTPAISLFVKCETQAEVDTYWQELTADGGKPGQCGWLKDKFGMSWQVVPTALLEMLQDQDAVKASRVAQAMQKMALGEQQAKTRQAVANADKAEADALKAQAELGMSAQGLPNNGRLIHGNIPVY